MATTMATRKVIKVIELVGVSGESWTDAAKNALAEASKTVHGITGMDVRHSTAVVEDGAIKEYHVDVRLAFVIEPEN